MTTPAGHPDYQAYAQWRGATSYTGSFNVTNVPNNFFQTAVVTNFAAVDLYVKLNSGVGVTIFAGFYADIAQTQFVGNFVFTLSGAGDVLQTILPCLGNSFALFIQTSQPGNQNVTVNFTPINVATTKAQYPISNNVVEAYSVNLLAGASVTATLPFICDGDGSFYMNPQTGGANVDAWVKELDESGTPIGDMVKLHNPGGPTTTPFLGGTKQIQMQIHNTDAAAHLYDYRVTVLPR